MLCSSARRGHKYDVLDHDDLQSMPVPLLLAPGGLVALWVTNNARHLQAAEEVRGGTTILSVSRAYTANKASATLTAIHHKNTGPSSSVGTAAGGTLALAQGDHVRRAPHATGIKPPKAVRGPSSSAGVRRRGCGCGYGYGYGRRLAGAQRPCVGHDHHGLSLRKATTVASPAATPTRLQWAAVADVPGHFWSAPAPRRNNPGQRGHQACRHTAVPFVEARLFVYERARV